MLWVTKGGILIINSLPKGTLRRRQNSEWNSRRDDNYSYFLTRNSSELDFVSTLHRLILIHLIDP